MKRDMRGQIIDFMKVHDKIPRDAKNDPHFVGLGGKPFDTQLISDWKQDCGEFPEGSVLSVFTPEEVVLMVNRFLFNMEYGRSWHRKWEREKAEKVAPLKKKVREMFNVSANRATREQLLAAQAELEKEGAKQ